MSYKFWVVIGVLGLSMVLFPSKLYSGQLLSSLSSHCLVIERDYRKNIESFYCSPELNFRNFGDIAFNGKPTIKTIKKVI